MEVNGSVGSEYFIKWTNVKYELLDNDGFGIEKIVLPDGREILQSSYKDILTSEGNYTYIVYDNNGRITEKTITAKIDKILPQLEFKYDNTPSVSGLLEVKAIDKNSGIQKIVDSTNTEHNTDRLNWRIESNGALSFKAYDKAGNVSSKIIDITNIDKDVTGINVTKSPDKWTNQDVNIELTVNDTNGIKYIITPSGDKIFSNNTNYLVNINGNYGFVICDNIGNIKNIQVNISNIDKINPSVSINKNPDMEWVNTDVGIIVNAKD